MAWIQSDVILNRYVPPSWADGTDEEIVDALQRHYAGSVDLTEYWSVGDERIVSLSAMEATGVDESHVAQDVVFVLSNVGGKYLADGVTECVFQVDQKDSLNETGYMNSSKTNTGGWKSCKRRTWCNNVYKNAIPSSLRIIFKEFINQSAAGGSGSGGVVENTTDTFAFRAEIEVFGIRDNSALGEGSQITWYETQANRIKQRNGSNSSWWERSASQSVSTSFRNVSNSGEYTGTQADISSIIGLAPFGVI